MVKYVMFIKEIIEPLPEPSSELDTWFMDYWRKTMRKRWQPPLEPYKDKLKAQLGRCALSKQSFDIRNPELVPSADHIVPVSRGGTSTVDNCQWVTARMNKMKGDLTNEEFRAEIQQIAEVHQAIQAQDTKRARDLILQGLRQFGRENYELAVSILAPAAVNILKRIDMPIHPYAFGALHTDAGQRSIQDYLNRNKD